MASIIQTGPTAWRVQIRKRGAKAITKTFRTEREARRFADRAEDDIEAGKTVQVGDAPTVKQAVSAFRELREHGQRPVKAGSTEHYMLKHLEEGLGPLRVDAVTPQRLVAWARSRMDDGAGPATIGMEVSKLGTVMRHAATWLHRPLPDLVTPARPLLEYSGLVGATNHRDRRPTREELGALLERADPQMADLIRAAIATCMRRGELARVLWADFDPARRVLTIRDRKHPRKTQGNHLTIPLLGNARDIIARQPRVDARIFPVSREWISDTFKELCDAARIVGLHFHDLRHEGISRLFEAGYAIEQVAMVSGHKKWEDLQRYTNLRPEALAAAGPSGAASPGARPRLGSQRSAVPDPYTSESEIDPR